MKAHEKMPSYAGNIKWDNVIGTEAPQIGSLLFGEVTEGRDKGKRVQTEWTGDQWGTPKLTPTSQLAETVDKMPLDNITLEHVYVGSSNAISADEAKQMIEGLRGVHVEPGYEPLFEELINALNQSQSGKGKARHNPDNDDFVDQPILTNARQVGPGGPAMQTMKKTGEAIGMFNRGEHDRAVAELHGAIIYAAATIILIKEKQRAS